MAPYTTPITYFHHRISFIYSFMLVLFSLHLATTEASSLHPSDAVESLPKTATTTSHRKIQMKMSPNAVVRRKKPLQNFLRQKKTIRSSAFEATDNGGQSKSAKRMTMENVTCDFYKQSLDHFSPPSSQTFHQRYCSYSGYDVYNNANKKNNNPIFFYVGNESPIDEYVNNTGLMWEMAPKHNALVIFAEHRYEGQSLPNFANLTENCLSYATSKQALADYATLISFIDPDHVRPVIVFGGSYGGMLAAWMRMIYPGSVAGAIASSAPIWGLPLTNGGIDGAYRVVSRAVRLPYPPTDSFPKNHGKDENNNGGIEIEEEKDDSVKETNYCFENILASWPLIVYYGHTTEGRSILSEQFNLCKPLKDENDVWALLYWAQNPWFDLAEGDFPFESSYIPYALKMGVNALPPWPLQKACHASGLHENLGIKFEKLDDDGGDIKDVKYKIVYGDGGIELNVDWDVLTWDSSEVEHLGKDKGEMLSQQKRDTEEVGLFRRLKDAVAVWFNVTGDLDCFDVLGNEEKKKKVAEGSIASGNLVKSKRDRQLRFSDDLSTTTPEQQCQNKATNEGCWTSLCCNENMNLIITEARGLGGDFFWPPTHPRGTKTYSDIVSARAKDISHDDKEEVYDSYCADPNEIFGYPSPPESNDPWSKWLDDYYGGLRIESQSNIVFSNGLLDPWSAAGVYAYGMNPTLVEKYDGPMVQNITRDGSVIALILDLGGHHLDLMYSTEEDPECAREARRIQEDHIGRWIQEWHESVERRICLSSSCT